MPPFPPMNDLPVQTGKRKPWLAIIGLLFVGVFGYFGYAVVVARIAQTRVASVFQPVEAIVLSSDVSSLNFIAPDTWCRLPCRSRVIPGKMRTICNLFDSGFSRIPGPGPVRCIDVLYSSTITGSFNGRPSSQTSPWLSRSRPSANQRMACG